MAYILSSGERHESKFLALRLETGAVVRAR